MRFCNHAIFIKHSCSAVSKYFIPIEDEHSEVIKVHFRKHLSLSRPISLSLKRTELVPALGVLSVEL